MVDIISLSKLLEVGITYQKSSQYKDALGYASIDRVAAFFLNYRLKWYESAD